MKMQFKIQNLKFKILNSKGVALTEIIVIMSLVILLALLAYPKFYGLQENADRANALNAAEAMAKALEMYRMDYKAYPATSSVNILMSYTNITSLKKAFDTSVVETDTGENGVGIYRGLSGEMCIEGIAKYLIPTYKVAYCVRYGIDNKTLLSNQPACYWSGKHDWQACNKGM